MDNIRGDFKATGGMVLGIGCSTNALAHKKAANVILHSARGAFYIERFCADLKQESVEDLMRKCKDLLERLSHLLGANVVIAFVSESFDEMRTMRNFLVDSKMVTWAYGCAPSMLGNFIGEFLEMDRFKSVVKKALFISIGIINSSLISKIYSALCLEKLSKVNNNASS